RRALLLAVRGGGEDDVGGGRRLGEERVDSDDPTGTGEGATGEVGVGEVAERIRAEQHEEVDLAVGGGGEDAGPVEAVSLRGEPELERADDVAPPERREHRRTRARLEHGAQRRGGDV